MLLLRLESTNGSIPTRRTTGRRVPRATPRRQALPDPSACPSGRPRASHCTVPRRRPGFKPLAGPGHLPTHDAGSAKPWLYGKLFAAPMAEGTVGYPESLSPGGIERLAKCTPSRWRESNVAFQQLQQAVNPGIRLQAAIDDWTEIAAGLSIRQGSG